MANPVFEGWYADPELHFFAGRFYIYPTTSAEYDRQTFFEAWSSDDLVSWSNEGVILDFADIPWSTNRVAWGAFMRAARQIQDEGSFAGFDGSATFAELNGLFS